MDSSVEKLEVFFKKGFFSFKSKNDLVCIVDKKVKIQKGFYEKNNILSIFEGEKKVGSIDPKETKDIEENDESIIFFAGKIEEYEDKEAWLAEAKLLLEEESALLEEDAASFSPNLTSALIVSSIASLPIGYWIYQQNNKPSKDSVLESPTSPEINSINQSTPNQETNEVTPSSDASINNEINVEDESANQIENNIEATANDDTQAIANNDQQDETTEIAEQVTISGRVTLGPVIEGHGLYAEVASPDGTLLPSVSIDEQGRFSFSVDNSEQLIKIIVKDDNDSADYIDEATGSAKNIGDQLSAIVVLEEDNENYLSVNPLTHISASVIEKQFGGFNSELASEDINTINHTISQQFLDTNIDITRYEIKPIISEDQTFQEGNIGGEVLATISLLQQDKTVAELNDFIVEELTHTNVIGVSEGLHYAMQQSLEDAGLISDLVTNALLIAENSYQENILKIATIDGDHSRVVNEDEHQEQLLTTSGSLVITNNTNEDEFIINEPIIGKLTTGESLGELTIDNAGQWQVTIDNQSPLVQKLMLDESINVEFEVSSRDGLVKTISVQVIGQNDALQSVAVPAEIGKHILVFDENKALIDLSLDHQESTFAVTVEESKVDKITSYIVAQDELFVMQNTDTFALLALANPNDYVVFRQDNEAIGFAVADENHLVHFEYDQLIDANLISIVDPKVAGPQFISSEATIIYKPNETLLLKNSSEEVIGVARMDESGLFMPAADIATSMVSMDIVSGSVLVSIDGVNKVIGHANTLVILTDNNDVVMHYGITDSVGELTLDSEYPLDSISEVQVVSANHPRLKIGDESSPSVALGGADNRLALLDTDGHVIYSGTTDHTGVLIIPNELVAEVTAVSAIHAGVNEDEHADGVLSAEGHITHVIDDVSGELPAGQVVNGRLASGEAFGELTLHEDGSWQVVFDNESALVQALKKDEIKIAEFSIQMTDDDVQLINIEIVGQNDLLKSVVVEAEVYQHIVILDEHNNIVDLVLNNTELTIAVSVAESRVDSINALSIPTDENFVIQNTTTHQLLALGEVDENIIFRSNGEVIGFSKVANDHFARLDHDQHIAINTLSITKPAEVGPQLMVTESIPATIVYQPTKTLLLKNEADEIIAIARTDNNGLAWPEEAVAGEISTVALLTGNVIVTLAGVNKIIGTPNVLLAVTDSTDNVIYFGTTDSEGELIIPSDYSLSEMNEVQEVEPDTPLIQIGNETRPTIALGETDTLLAVFDADGNVIFSGVTDNTGQLIIPDEHRDNISHVAPIDELSPLLRVGDEAEPVVVIGEPNTVLAVKNIEGSVIFSGVADNNGELVIPNALKEAVDTVVQVTADSPVLQIAETSVLAISEPNKVIVIRDAMNNVLHSGLTDSVGQLIIPLELKETVSSVETVNASAPVVYGGEDGAPVIVISEPNTVIAIRDDDGNVIFSGYTDNNGKLVIASELLESVTPVDTASSANEEGDYALSTTLTFPFGDNSYSNAEFSVETVSYDSPIIQLGNETNPTIVISEVNTILALINSDDEIIFVGMTDNTGKLVVPDEHANAIDHVDTVTSTSPVVYSNTEQTVVVGEPGSIIAAQDDQGNFVYSGVSNSEGQVVVPNNLAPTVIAAHTVTFDSPIILAADDIAVVGEPNTVMAVKDEQSDVIYSGVTNSEGVLTIPVELQSQVVSVQSVDASSPLVQVGEEQTTIVSAAHTVLLVKNTEGNVIYTNISDAMGQMTLPKVHNDSLASVEPVSTEVLVTLADSLAFLAVATPNAVLAIKDDAGNVIYSGLTDAAGQLVIPASSQALADKVQLVTTESPLLFELEGSTLALGEPDTLLVVKSAYGEVIHSGFTDNQGQLSVPSSVASEASSVQTVAEDSPLIQNLGDESIVIGFPDSVVAIKDSLGVVLHSGITDELGVLSIPSAIASLDESLTAMSVDEPIIYVENGLVTVSGQPEHQVVVKNTAGLILDYGFLSEQGKIYPYVVDYTIDELRSFLVTADTGHVSITGNAVLAIAPPESIVVIKNENGQLIIKGRTDHSGRLDGVYEGDYVSTDIIVVEDHNPQVVSIDDQSVVLGASGALIGVKDRFGQTIDTQITDAMGEAIVEAADEIYAYGTYAEIISFAPTSLDNSLTVNEDETVTFHSSDFVFIDTDPDAILSAIKVHSLPAKGTLLLDGVAVALNDKINVEDIDNLTFTPALNENGDDYTLFTFSIFDDHDVESLETYDLNINVNPVDDTPVITGDVAFNLAEDSPMSLSGELTVTDPDLNESAFQPTLSPVTLNYGTFSITAEGNWSYDADHTQAVIQALAEGQTLLDSVTFQTVDGTDVTMNFTIDGENDIANIGGVNTASFSEDDAASLLSTSGQLSIADVDQGEAGFVEQTQTGTYGDLSLLTDGNWQYTADNSATEIQQLVEGQTVEDTFVVQSIDGTSASITISIQGTNDSPQISGTNTARLIEDTDAVADMLSFTTDLSITDIDLNEGAFVNETIAGSYAGTASITALGSWMYQVDNASNAIQSLAAAEEVLEQFSFSTLDGTAYSVSVTLEGSNDTPSLVAASNIAETEESLGLGVSGATGYLLSTATDIDDGSSLTVHSIDGQILTAGTITIAIDFNYIDAFGNSQTENIDLTVNQDGSYNLEAVNLAALPKDELATGSFDYVVSDEHGATSSTETVAIAITGANNAPQLVTGTTVTNTEDELETGITATTNLVALATDADDANLQVHSVDGTELTGSTLITSISLDYFDKAGIAQVQTQALTVNTDGSFSLSAFDFDDLPSDQVATGNFTFIITDGDDVSAEQTVNIEITGTNDSPGLIAASAIEMTEANLADGVTSSTGYLLTQVSDIDDLASLIKVHSVDGIELTAGAVTVQIDLTYNDDIGNPQTQAVNLNVDAAGTYSIDALDLSVLPKDEVATGSFVYIVSDDEGATSTAETIAITVSGINNIPQLLTGTAVTGTEDELEAGIIATTNLVALATDADDANLQVHSVDGIVLTENNLTTMIDLSYEDRAGNAAIQEVAVTIDADGHFTVDAFDFDALPTGNIASGSFNFTITDIHGAVSTEQTVTIDITGTNDNPSLIAINTISKDEIALVNGVSEAAGTLLNLASDSDDPDPVLKVFSVEGEALSGGVINKTITLSYLSAEGSAVTHEVMLSVTELGAYTLDADNGALPSDVVATGSFSYVVSDDEGATSTEETVNIEITGINNDPDLVITQHIEPTEDDLELGIENATGFLLSQASDVDDTTLTIYSVDGELIVDGSLSKTLSLSYLDAAGTAQTSSVTLTITDQGNYSFSTLDLDELPTGNIASGSFTYRVADDENALSTEETINVLISGTNEAPLLVAADAIEDNEDVLELGIIGTSGSLLEGATDVDDLDEILSVHSVNGDVLVDGSVSTMVNFVYNDALGVQQNQAIEMIVHSDGSYDLTMDFDALPEDNIAVGSFSYIAADDEDALSSAQSTNIFITGINDNPVANDDVMNSLEGEVKILNVLDNDIDVDSTSITITEAQIDSVVHSDTRVNRQDGTLTIQDNALLFNPGKFYQYIAEDEVSIVNISYSITDELGLLATANVALEVQGEADPLITRRIYRKIVENETDTIDVLSHVTDADGRDDPTEMVVTHIEFVDEPGAIVASQGNAIVTGNEVFYDSETVFDYLNTGETATVLMRYTFNDIFGEPASDFIEMTILGVNDNPTSLASANVPKALNLSDSLLLADFSTLTDLSASQLSMSLDGNVTQSQGKIQTALEFDGTGGSAQLGTMTLASELTLSCWLKVDDLTATGAHFLSLSNIDAGTVALTEAFTIGLGTEANSLAIQTAIGSVHSQDNFFTEGEWTHLALTIDQAQTLSVYKNGALALTAENVDFSAGDRLENYVGKSALEDATHSPFDGAIEQLMVFDKAATDAEIASHYHVEKFSDLASDIVTENTAFDISLDASIFADLDTTDEFSFSLVKSPEWINIDPVTGHLVGTPLQDDISHQLAFNAADYVGQSNQTEHRYVDDQVIISAGTYDADQPTDDNIRDDLTEITFLETGLGVTSATAVNDYISSQNKEFIQIDYSLLPLKITQMALSLGHIDSHFEHDNAAGAKVHVLTLNEQGDLIQAFEFDDSDAPGWVSDGSERFSVELTVPQGFSQIRIFTTDEHSEATPFDTKMTVESVAIVDFVNTATIQATDKGGLTATSVMDLRMVATNDQPELLQEAVPFLHLSLSNSHPNDLAEIDSAISIAQLLTPQHGLALFSDEEGALPGIAVFNAVNGVYYSIDDGNQWLDLSIASPENAILLDSDALLFAQSEVTQGNIIGYRAWDQSTGQTGETADLTTSVDQDSFSTQVDYIQSMIGVDKIDNGEFVRKSSLFEGKNTELGTSNSHYGLLNVSDVNNDGNDDFIVNLSPTTQTLWHSYRAPHEDINFTDWNLITGLESINPYSEARAIDWNLDNYNDLLVLGDNTLSLYLNDRTDDVSMTYAKTLLTGIEGFSLADLNHDGQLDIVFRDQENLKVMFNKAGIGLTPHFTTSEIIENTNEKIPNIVSAKADTVVITDIVDAAGNAVAISTAQVGINASDDHLIEFNPGNNFDFLAAGETALVNLSYTAVDEFGAESAATLSIAVTGAADYINADVYEVEGNISNANNAIATDTPGARFVVKAIGLPDFANSRKLAAWFESSVDGVQEDFNSLFDNGIANKVVNYTGLIALPAGDTQFFIQADDGYEIKIDGNTEAHFHGFRAFSEATDSFTYSLTEAQLLPFQMIYYNASGAGGFEVKVQMEDGSTPLLSTDNFLFSDQHNIVNSGVINTDNTAATTAENSPVSIDISTHHVLDKTIAVDKRFDLADVNSDGLLDLIEGTKLGDVSVFVNEGSASTPLFDINAPQVIESGGYYLYPRFVDINQDNQLDYIRSIDMGHIDYWNNPSLDAINDDTIAGYFYIEDAMGRALSAHDDVEYNTSGLTFDLADFNHDGVLDLITGTNSSRGISLAFGFADNSIYQPTETDLAGLIQTDKGTSFYDANKDGLVDAVTAFNNTLYFHPGQFDGFFATSTVETLLDFDHTAADINLIHHDLNQDGTDELIVVNGYHGEAIKIYGFSAEDQFIDVSSLYPALSSLFSGASFDRGVIDLVIGDFNGDKLDDVYLSSELTGTAVYLQNEDASYQSPIAFSQLLFDQQGNDFIQYADDIIDFHAVAFTDLDSDTQKNDLVVSFLDFAGHMSDENETTHLGFVMNEEHQQLRVMESYYPRNIIAEELVVEEDIPSLIEGVAVHFENNKAATLTLSVAEGTLSIEATDLTFLEGENNTESFTIFGTAEDINTALSQLTYTPPENFNGDVSFFMKALDTNGYIDENTVNLVVNPVNDPAVFEHFLMPLAVNRISEGVSQDIQILTGDGATFNTGDVIVVRLDDPNSSLFYESTITVRANGVDNWFVGGDIGLQLMADHEGVFSALNNEGDSILFSGYRNVLRINDKDAAAFTLSSQHYDSEGNIIDAEAGFLQNTTNIDGVIFNGEGVRDAFETIEIAVPENHFSGDEFILNLAGETVTYSVDPSGESFTVILAALVDAINEHTVLNTKVSASTSENRLILDTLLEDTALDCSLAVKIADTVYAVQNETFALTPIFSEPEGDALTFSITNQPDGLYYDEEKGMLIGAFSEVAQYEGVAFVIDDGTAVSSHDLRFIVEAPVTIDSTFAFQVNPLDYLPVFIDSADFSSATSGITFDMTNVTTAQAVGGGIAHDGEVASLYSVLDSIGSSFDDTYSLGQLSAGDHFTLDAGEGNDVLNLVDYTASVVQLEQLQGENQPVNLTVDLADGVATLAVHNIERFNFAENIYDGTPHGVSSATDIDKLWSMQGNEVRIADKQDRLEYVITHYSGTLDGDFELGVSVIADNTSELSGGFANGYIIFDYQNENDFKAAGARMLGQDWIIYDKSEEGLTALSSIVDLSLQPNQLSTINLSISDNTVVLHTENGESISHSFLDDDGNPDLLNDGQMGAGGIGTDNITTIDFQPSNWAPFAPVITQSLDINSGVTAIDLVANANDIDADELSISELSFGHLGQGDHGRFVNLGDGTVTYTPSSEGTETFSYKVSDGVNDVLSEVRLHVTNDAYELFGDTEAYAVNLRVDLAENETAEIILSSLVEGMRISDGTNSHKVTDTTSLDVSSWDYEAIQVVAPLGFSGVLTINAELTLSEGEVSRVFVQPLTAEITGSQATFTSLYQVSSSAMLSDALAVIDADSADARLLVTQLMLPGVSSSAQLVDWFADSYTVAEDLDNLFDGATVGGKVFHYKGFLNLPTGETRLYVRSDDGYQMKIDGETVAEFTGHRGFETGRETVIHNQDSAAMVPFEIVYYNAGGGAAFAVTTDEDGLIPVSIDNILVGDGVDLLVDSMSENAIFSTDVITDHVNEHTIGLLTVASDSVNISSMQDTNGNSISINTAQAIVNTSNNRVIDFDPGTDFDFLALGETAQVSIQYLKVDNLGTQAVGQLKLTVTGTNDAPIAVVDNATTTEVNPVSVNVVENDIDHDLSDTLTIQSGSVVISSMQDHAGDVITALTATASINSTDNQVIDFNPGTDFDFLALGESATVDIAYSIEDTQGEESSGSLQVTVTGTNNAPVAIADTANTAENSVVTVNVIANDTDIDTSAPLSIKEGSVAIIDIQDAEGNVKALSTAAVAINALDNQSIDFDPATDLDFLAEGEIATVTIAYSVLDDRGAESIGSLIITVDGHNDNPVALDINAESSNEDETRSISTTEILNNVVDPDSPETLSLSSLVIRDSSMGAVLVNEDSSYTYSPPMNWSGNVILDYSITDGELSSSATYSFEVSAVADAPRLVFDLFDLSTPIEILDIADFSGLSTPVSFDITNDGVQTVNNDMTPSIWGVTSATGTNFNDVFTFEFLQAGDEFTINGGDGDEDIIKLDNISADRVTIDTTGQQNTLSVDFDGGEVATINFSNIEKFDFNTAIFDGTPHSIEPTSSGDWVITGKELWLDSVGKGSVVGLIDFQGSLDSSYSLNLDLKTYDVGTGTFNGAIVFDYVDDNNYKAVYARVGAQLWAIEELMNGVSTRIVYHLDSIPQEEWVSIELRVEGEVASLYSNGIERASHDFGENLSDGRIGVVNQDAQTSFVLAMEPSNWAPSVVDYDVKNTIDIAYTTDDLVSAAVDQELDTLSIIGFTQATNGTVVDNNNGTLTYAPAEDFIGVDSFTYDISDGSNISVGQIRISTSSNEAISIEPGGVVGLNIVPELTDLDSETLEVFIDDLPLGSIISDTNNTTTFSSGNGPIDLSAWDLSQIQITIPEDVDGILAIPITAMSTESNGHTDSTIRTFTLHVNVADGGNTDPTDLSEGMNATVLTESTLISGIELDDSVPSDYLTQEAEEIALGPIYSIQLMQDEALVNLIEPLPAANGFIYAQDVNSDGLLSVLDQVDYKALSDLLTDEAVNLEDSVLKLADKNELTNLIQANEMDIVDYGLWSYDHAAQDYHLIAQDDLSTGYIMYQVIG